MFNPLDNSHTRTRNSAWIDTRLLLSALCLIALCSTGCSRTFWRKQADDESYRLLTHKMTDERWMLPRIDVTPSPDSRLFDPYDPDRPPLPPDDPAAHQYMHHMSYHGVIDGYDGWHELGQSMSVENPHWLGQFGLEHDQLCPPEQRAGKPVPTINNLTLTQALELAAINSREYQTEIENLYFAALDLTLERFQFNVRFLGIGGGEPSANLTYQNIPDGQNSLSANTRFGVSQLLPSGAQWAVELANNTLWVFSGDDSTSTQSILSYSLVQPLLRGAGRKVVLENLTFQERAVLYQTRGLARFRKVFFTDIVSSYLDLLQTIQSIDNLENNIELLEDQLLRLRASSELREFSRFTTRLIELDPQINFPPEVADQLSYDNRQRILIFKGDMTQDQMRILRTMSDNPAFLTAVNDLIQQQTADQTSLELIQLESRFVSSQNSLRQARQNYETSLDQFKLLLGLPTDFRISIDESLIAPFQLIDDILSGTTEDLNEAINRLPIPEDEPTVDDYLAVVEQFEQELVASQRETIAIVEADSEEVKPLLENGAARANNSAEGDPNYQRLKTDVERDLRLLEDEKSSFQVEVERLAELKASLIEYRDNNSMTPELSKAIYEQLGSIREQLIRISQSLQVLQIGFRVELIELEPFNMTMDGSVAYAMANRLDLMNARAQVMDARRQMEVAANQLEAVLNVRAEGDVRTPVGTRPFDFRGTLSNFRVGLGFTAPLDQINERNNYRASLIAYQRAKREYMALEDLVKQQVRQSHRNLTVLRQNFETARQSVRINARQYDITVELANSRNPSPNQGLNILNALDSVLSAQNQLIGIFINYETNRLNIHRDMGMMDIDERGVWRDPFYQGQQRASNSPPRRQLRRHILPPRLVNVRQRPASGNTPTADLKLASGLVSAPPVTRVVPSEVRPAANSDKTIHQTITPVTRPVAPPDPSSGPTQRMDSPPAENLPHPVSKSNEISHDQAAELHRGHPPDPGSGLLDVQRLEPEQSGSGWRPHHGNR